MFDEHRVKHQVRSIHVASFLNAEITSKMRKLLLKSGNIGTSMATAQTVNTQISKQVMIMAAWERP